MKKWEELREDYERAEQKKQNKEQELRLDAQNEALRAKTKKLWVGCLDGCSVGSVSWRGVTATLCRERFGDMFDFQLYFADLNALATGNLTEAKNLIEKRLVHELGAVMVNRSEDFGIMDIKRVLLDIEASICAVCLRSDVVEDVARRLKEERRISKRVHAIERAINNRFYRPRELWEEMARAWAKDELFRVGSKIMISWYPYEIAKLGDKFVTFTNGTRKAYESIDIYDQFRKAHPEVKKYPL